MSFAARLRTERIQLGISQELLGEKVGVSQDTISKWERGLSSATTGDLELLCQLFECSADYLIGLSQNRHGLPVGLFIIDDERVSTPEPGEDWGFQIPQKPRIVSYAEMRRLQAIGVAQMRTKRRRQ